MAVALTIAGSDSIGGAGVQADIKALASMGVHCASVITCVTSQNTRRVKDIYPLPVRTVISQLDAVLEDADLDALKTGMLYSAEVVEAVAERIEQRVIPLVVDPVMVAGVGDSLHQEGLMEALKGSLIPLCCCVTPNLHEAESLSGMRIASLGDARKACRSIAGLGARSVLLKGGHLQGDMVTDLLLYEDEFTEIKAPRIDVRPHGSGCHLSAYIAGYLTQGIGIKEAVIAARGRMQDALTAHISVGKGLDLVGSLATLEREALRYPTLMQLKEGVAQIVPLLTRDWIPEVGSNFAYALPMARYLEDVCALEGRLHRVGDEAAAFGCLAYGASRHVARTVLAAMAHDPAKRCAINLRYSWENLSRFEGAGMVVGHFDGGKRPKGRAGLVRGMELVIRRTGSVPDVICDKGGVGKEAMIMVMGNDPDAVVRKVRDAVSVR